MKEKTDFDSIAGSKKKASYKEKKPAKFTAKTKPQEEKAAKEFDYKKITSQVKETTQAIQNPSGKPAPLTKKIDAAAKENATGKKIERIKTGITGLDSLIEGGFEKNSTILIAGSAGTGKTLFGLQFLYNGAKDYNEPGIFISFEENKESLYKHSSSFGWDFETLEKKGLFKVLQYKLHQIEKIMREGGSPIKDAIKATGAKRLVIDSITSYGLLFKDNYQRREGILEFFNMLEKLQCTSMIISELPPKVAEIKEGSVGFLTDAIISLYYSKEAEKRTRVHSCEILKMRGTKHTNKLLAMDFEKNGLAIYPEVEVF